MIYFIFHIIFYIVFMKETYTDIKKLSLKGSIKHWTEKEG